MAGAPDVMTNALQQPSMSDPYTDAVAVDFRNKRIVQDIPVYQPSFQFSVPERQFYRGWIAPDVPTVAGPTYPQPVQAPDVIYANKSYQYLIQKSANPTPTPNRQPVQLTAPDIQTTY